VSVLLSLLLLLVLLVVLVSDATAGAPLLLVLLWLPLLHQPAF